MRGGRRSLADGAGVGHGAAPNTVPVVADGKVFVASYKELRAFGTGSAAACSTTIAAAPPASFAAPVQTDPAYPATGKSGIVRGIIAEVTDAKDVSPDPRQDDRSRPLECVGQRALWQYRSRQTGHNQRDGVRRQGTSQLNLLRKLKECGTALDNSVSIKLRPGCYFDKIDQVA